MDAMVISMRVTAPDRRIARVSIGSRQFSIGRPLEFDDASPHVAAMEYALGAVGGEVVNGIRAFAARRRLEIDAIEAVVTGELAGGLTYLEVIGEDGTPRIARIHVKVFVAAEKGPPSRPSLSTCSSGCRSSAHCVTPSICRSNWFSTPDWRIACTDWTLHSSGWSRTPATVADAHIRPHAARVDAEGAFPRESIAALGRDGLLGLTIPAAYGGMGQGLRTMAATLDTVAQQCASTAMVYLMHLCGVACYAAAPDANGAVLRDAAAGRHLSTLAFSEKGSRSHFWAPVSRAARDGDGTVR